MGCSCSESSPNPCDSEDCVCKKACNPSPSQFCSDSLANLPLEPEVQLTGIKNGERCLSRLDSECKTGMIVVDRCSVARISNTGFDLHHLVSYIRDVNGVAITDSNGQFVQGEPPLVPFLMVMSATQGLCDEDEDIVYKWHKWQGLKGVSGVVSWNDGFTITDPYADDILTRRIPQETSVIRLAGFCPTDIDGAYDPEQKRRIFQFKGGCGILYSNETHNVQVFAPSESGLLYIRDGKPEIATLCDIATDDCGNQIPPKNLLGCTDGETTSTITPDFGELPDAASGFAVTWCEGEAGYIPAPIGRTFWPCPALLTDVQSPASGNLAQTITGVLIASATGKPIPKGATHVRVRARLCLSTGERDVLKQSTMTLAGVDAALVKVQHYADEGTNESVDTVSLTVPLESNSIPFTISADDGTTYVYTIWMEGYEVEPCPLDCN